jgi:hypothetical protein
MRIVGIIATSVAAIVVLLGVVIGVRSIDDVRRYLRMRSM